MLGQLNISIINKLTLARHLYWLAEQQLRVSQDIVLFAAANLMQDSVEAYLLACAEFVDAKIDTRAAFENYFSRIEEKFLADSSISIRQLPFRTRLNTLNKIRVNSKHFGIKPDRRELEGLLVVVKEFFEECAKSLYQSDFWTINLLELLDDCECRRLLVEAQQALNESRFVDCLIECRKAIFVEIEKSYSVARFRDMDGDVGFFGFFCKAPYYTCNKKWIDENVSDVFQFVQLDHEKLNRELIENDIDITVFWNIWRLTPSVFRYDDDSQWFVKNELQKIETASIGENAVYVFNSTVDLVLRLYERRRAIRVGELKRFEVNLIREGVPLYGKADKGSPVRDVTGPGVRKLVVTASCPAFDGSGRFWIVSHLESMEKMKWYSGYLSDEDVDWS